MSTPTPAGNRRSWEYPECPECKSDVLVEVTSNGHNSTAYCWSCDLLFEIGDRRLQDAKEAMLDE
jgi:transcription elongation factor Elf1